MITGCQRGERIFQEMLYRQMASKMLGICLRYSRDTFEAEDILQTAFVKVFQKINLYKGEGSFEGWVRRIMVNTSIEFYRKRLRSLKVVEMNNQHDIGVDIDLGQLQAKDLLNLIQSLSPGYRLVFNLYAIEGYSHKEIADQLGISEGASKSQLSRARAILREQVINMERNSNYGTNVG
mgnify:CR=1 FL=1